MLPGLDLMQCTDLAQHLITAGCGLDDLPGTDHEPSFRRLESLDCSVLATHVYRYIIPVVASMTVADVPSTTPPTAACHVPSGNPIACKTYARTREKLYPRLSRLRERKRQARRGNIKIPQCYSWFRDLLHIL